METSKIKIDLILLTCIAEVLGRVPETMYDFQKVKNLSCGGKPLTRRIPTMILSRSGLRSRREISA